MACPARKVLVALVSSLFAAPLAFGNPVGPAVVNGTVGFATVGKTLTVTNTPSAIINWQGFSIGTGETTRFAQQSAASAVLNRVGVGASPSEILGTLQSQLANGAIGGRVFLLNPNGIVFGVGSRVDVAGLVASTLNLSNQDFLAGRLNFEAGAVANPILNHGNIATPSGGRVYLIAPNVENHGVISTPQGQTILAAGKSVQLVEVDVPNLRVEIQAGGEALNVGQIIAEGGSAGIYAGLINQKGIVRADTPVLGEGGRISFRASGNIALEKGSVTSANGPSGGSVTLKSDAGGILVSGALEANGIAGQGGTVTMEAPWVALGGVVAADGTSAGGAVTVETGWLSLADRVSARGGSGAGGAIQFDVAGTTVQNLSSLVDASGASGGSIRHVAGRQITTSGTYLANGSSGPGGRIDLSAPATKLLSAKLHADGATGGGQVRVGGEFQGGKGLAADELSNAELLAISSGSVITADATQSGAGGTVITWANLGAAMFGDVSARPAGNAAGTTGAAGGFIEISSGDKLTYGGTASAGLGGTVLFDPKNIVIATATGASQYAIVLGYNYANVARLKGNDLDAGDNFGAAVSLSGTQLAVGASLDNGAGNATIRAGAVYLFNNPFTAPALAGVIGKGYTGSGNFNVSALELTDTFGSSVSLSGTQLAVGAPRDNGVGNVTSDSGAVYLFNNPFTAPALAGVIGLGYTPAVTGLAASLDVSALEGNDEFGTSVSLAGTQLAVGAPRDSGAGNSATESGAVYLFNNPFTAPALAGVIGKGYTPAVTGLAASLDVSALESLDQFGTSVSLSGTQLAVGAPRDFGADNIFVFAGAVYLFNNPFTAPALAGVIGKGYTPVVTGLAASLDVTALGGQDAFGFSVSLSGTQLAVGAGGDDGLGDATFNASGAVYLFNNPFGTPTQAGIIGKDYTTASGPSSFNVAALEALDQFGSSVSLYGTQLAVGAKGDAGAGNATPGAGAVYLFNNPFTAPALAGVIGKGYTGAGNFDPGNALETGDQFGSAVSLSGTQLAVGTYGDGGFGNVASLSGAVYLFNNPFTTPTLSGIIGKGYTGAGNYDVSALEASDSFGSAVSLSGTQLAVGAFNDAGSGNVAPYSGAVYLFNNPFGATTLSGTIGKGYTGAGSFDVSALEAGDFFGSAVSLSGTQLAVGAMYDGGSGNVAPSSGAVYLFNNRYTTATLTGIIGKGYTGAGNYDVTALEVGDAFGSNVSLSGTQLAVGAIGDDGAGNSAPDSGAVYGFNLGGGDAVTSATFANNPGANSTITPAAITAITNTGSSVVLQANNDITLAAASNIVTSAAGAGGAITLQAGRSVLLNSNITTDNGNLTIKANEQLASGVVDAQRDPGAAVITMAPGTTINAGSGTVTIALRDGAGLTYGQGGAITLGNLSGANVTLQNDTAGGAGGIGILGTLSAGVLTATTNGGNFNVTGATTISSAATVTVGAGNASFTTVEGPGSLAVNSSGVETFGAVGTVTPLASITTDAPGTVSLGGNVTTTGAQTFNDALTAGTVALTSTGGGAILVNNASFSFPSSISTTGVVTFAGALVGTSGAPLALLVTPSGLVFTQVTTAFLSAPSIPAAIAAPAGSSITINGVLFVASTASIAASGIPAACTGLVDPTTGACTPAPEIPPPPPQVLPPAPPQPSAPPRDAGDETAADAGTSATGEGPDGTQTRRRRVPRCG